MSRGNRPSAGTFIGVRKEGWSTMKRILVVEDENWLAMELSWLVQEAGYAVLGPERSVAEACKLLDRIAVDLALLDVAVGDDTVFPLSRVLEDMGVPFIFLTGKPGLLPAEYSWRPLVPKPWQPTALLALISRVLGPMAT
jgi:DNA-binding response OmpR family regulator